MSSSCCCDCSPKSEPAEIAITSAAPQATEAAAQQLIAKSEKSECCNDKPAKSEKHSCGC
jgi:hypothetical protein